MTDPEQTTLRVLRELERHDAERRNSDDTAAPASAPHTRGQQPGAVSAADMLEALVATNFDLSAAIVKLRRDA